MLFFWNLGLQKLKKCLSTLYILYLENGQKCSPTILVETIFNVEESDLSVYYKSIRNNIRSANFFTKASMQAGVNEIT